jgi:hypothetical protein
MYLSSSTGFCANCGAQLGGGTRQPVKQRKPTSGWAKFGGTLFVLGVLCIIVGPVLIMMKPEAEQSTALIIRYVVIGALGVVIGLPLMFKG